MGKLIDLTFQRFGRLTVKGAYRTNKINGQVEWLCKCDCGGVKWVRSSHLRSGHTSSCGCEKGHFSHRESDTRLYHIWAGMISRCMNVSHKQYEHYGRRNIKVCKEWLDYVAFRDWAMANGYEDNLSIDRINNDGSYCPENCRWATAKQQANNTRKTRLLTFNGDTHSVSEWARILGIKQSTLSMRINKYGWSVEKALGKEIRNYGS